MSSEEAAAEFFAFANADPRFKGCSLTAEFWAKMTDAEREKHKGFARGNALRYKIDPEIRMAMKISTRELIEAANACSERPTGRFVEEKLMGLASAFRKAFIPDPIISHDLFGCISGDADHLVCECRIQPLIHLTAAKTMEEVDNCLLGWIIERTISWMQFDPALGKKSPYMFRDIDNWRCCPFRIFVTSPEGMPIAVIHWLNIFHECRRSLVRYLRSVRPDDIESRLLSLFPASFRDKHPSCRTCRTCVNQDRNDFMFRRYAFELTQDPWADPAAQAAELITSMSIDQAAEGAKPITAPEADTVTEDTEMATSPRAGPENT